MLMTRLKVPVVRELARKQAPYGGGGEGGKANGVKQSKKLAKEEGVQPRGVRLPFPVPRLTLSHCRAWSQAP